MGPVLARQAPPRGRKQLSQGPWRTLSPGSVRLLSIVHGVDAAGEGRAKGSRLQRKAGWQPAAPPGEALAGSTGPPEPVGQRGGEREEGGGVGRLGEWEGWGTGPGGGSGESSEGCR